MEKLDYVLHRVTIGFTGNMIKPFWVQPCTAVRFLRSRQRLRCFQVNRPLLLQDIFSEHFFSDRVTKGTLWKDKEKTERCQVGDERDIDLRWEWETGSGPPLATVKEGTKKREMVDVEKYCLEKTLMLFATKDFGK